MYVPDSININSISKSYPIHKFECVTPIIIEEECFTGLPVYNFFPVLSHFKKMICPAQ